MLLYGDFPLESEDTDLMCDARYIHFNVTVMYGIF